MQLNNTCIPQVLADARFSTSNCDEIDFVNYKVNKILGGSNSTANQPTFQSDHCIDPE